ncbi:MAG: biotin synthase BioB [Myxococcota bacterium]|jgi:biotin synthase|nr:biotin synthase BioB [Myxococcota bacterium]
MTERYAQLAQNALDDAPLSEADARWILDGEDIELLALVQAAFIPRRTHFGRQVGVQVLNNVQNGLCPEDCGYCAQSKTTKAPVREYPMKSDEEILKGAAEAAAGGAVRYCMAMSGRGPSLHRAERFAKLIRQIKSEHDIEVCLSAGLMGDEHVAVLKAAGLDRMNHNLNTSEAHYNKICSTHTYADRVATLEAAQRAGIELCSGLIIGMGETSEDIIEVVFKLHSLGAPSIPVNFLIPIEGNAVQDDGSLSPERCLRVLCLVRLANPRAEIRIAGGREGHLRGLQSLALYAANSLFVGGYLTTRGDAWSETFGLIEDAGFEVAESARGKETQTETRTRSGFRLPGSEALLRPDVAASAPKAHR